MIGNHPFSPRNPSPPACFFQAAAFSNRTGWCPRRPRPPGSFFFLAKTAKNYIRFPGFEKRPRKGGSLGRIKLPATKKKKKKKASAWCVGRIPPPISAILRLADNSPRAFAVSHCFPRRRFLTDDRT